LFVPPMMIWAYTSGYVEASSAVGTNQEWSELQIKNFGPLKAIPLRFMDRGLLFKTSANTIIFRPWDQIESIQTVARHRPIGGFICLVFHVCPYATVAPNTPKAIVGSDAPKASAGISTTSAK
jgi:hypothetical protein